LTADEIGESIEVNLAAPAILVAALAPRMRARGRGHFVLMSSMAGKMATEGNGSLYAATKWGLRGLGLSLRNELRGTGVGVWTMFPGPISEVGMFAGAGVDLPAGITSTSPEQVARAVARAIEHDRPEVDVAGSLLRLGGWLGPISPRLVAFTARRQGAGQVRR